MCDKDEIPLEEEEKSIEHKLIEEMKHKMNEITHLKIELLMARLRNNELEMKQLDLADLDYISDLLEKYHEENIAISGVNGLKFNKQLQDKINKMKTEKE